MGDLRPLGSEKLQGMDKIKRILEISKYNETPKSDINENATLNYTIELADGYTYGIVKERLGYIIKKGLNESILEYSEPMRQRKYYRSYSEAMKKLNLTAAELNRIYENEEGTALIGEQDAQKKKFVLKLPKKGNTKTPDVGMDTAPAPPPPAPAPATETPAPPMDAPAPPTEEPAPDMSMGEPTDMGSEDIPPSPEMGGQDMGAEPSDDNQPKEDDFDLGDEEAPQPSFKSIQRLTGKLSQRLRQIEKDKSLESDDIKYVLNSILSALNLENLDEEDREDILSKFDEDEDEYGTEGPGSLDMSSEDDFDMGGDTSMEEPIKSEPKEDFYMFNESTVEKVLTKYFDVKPEERKVIEEKNQKRFIKEKITKVQVKKEITRLSENVRQMEVAFEMLNQNAKFVGKTNKENLVFIKEGKQIRVNQRGQII